MDIRFQPTIGTTINDRIQIALSETRYKPPDLARHMGTSNTNIYKHLSKEVTHIPVVLGVHELTGADLVWLIKGEGTPFPDTQQEREELERYKRMLDELFKRLG